MASCRRLGGAAADSQEHTQLTRSVGCGVLSALGWGYGMLMSRCQSLFVCVAEHTWTRERFACMSILMKLKPCHQFYFIYYKLKEYSSSHKGHYHKQSFHTDYSEHVGVL